ncbi:MAG: RNA degradosome polyphosphate kinase, partial [Candidatus Dormibacteria bacterium]
MAEHPRRTGRRTTSRSARQRPPLKALKGGEDELSDPLRDPSCYINRELSWLNFDLRVLAEARDGRVPLLERLRFLAITANNLDEFYMIRVASLKRQQGEHFQATHPDRMTPTAQLQAIAELSGQLVATQLRCLVDEVAPALAAQGVRLVLSGEALTREEIAACDSFFERQLYPLLTPLAIDPAHPFPYLSNLSLSIA